MLLIRYECWFSISCTSTIKVGRKLINRWKSLYLLIDSYQHEQTRYNYKVVAMTSREIFGITWKVFPINLIPGVRLRLKSSFDKGAKCNQTEKKKSIAIAICSLYALRTIHVKLSFESAAPMIQWFCSICLIQFLSIVISLRPKGTVIERLLHSALNT